MQGCVTGPGSWQPGVLIEVISEAVSSPSKQLSTKTTPKGAQGFRLIKSRKRQFGSVSQVGAAKHTVPKAAPSLSWSGLASKTAWMGTGTSQAGHPADAKGRLGADKP